MSVNRDNSARWKTDIAESVDLYNTWFLNFAPLSYRETRIATTKSVETALSLTKNLTDVSPAILTAHPEVLPTLRMSTAPPIARDRLVGLAGVSKNLVMAMETEGRLPPRMARGSLTDDLERIGQMIERLADGGIFPWLESGHSPLPEEIHRAATIVADRLCGAVADPIVRNAQEQRQLAYIAEWLNNRGYQQNPSGTRLTAQTMMPGTYSFRLNVPVRQTGTEQTVNIPVDVAIQPHTPYPTGLPLLVEAKSAGDFTNTNKRRKEEAQKIAQLRATYGDGVQFILFLCGYFDAGYLGYEASEGIDWVWEHRIDDLALFGV